MINAVYGLVYRVIKAWHAEVSALNELWDQVLTMWFCCMESCVQNVLIMSLSGLPLDTRMPL